MLLPLQLLLQIPDIKDLVVDYAYATLVLVLYITGSTTLGDVL